MTHVERIGSLSSIEIEDVLRLAQAAGDTDGTSPLSEHTVLHVRHGHEKSTSHLAIRVKGTLAGYALVDFSDDVDGPSAELTVHPMHRRQGHGRRLLEAAIDVAEEHDAEGRLRLWAHGNHPSASALALRLGFARHRSLWQMRRSLYSPIGTSSFPSDVTVRAFEPGRDEQAWLDANAQAFAQHPEQGRWSRSDLERRMAESWFDPAGFLLAVRGEKLLGFHWMKVHRDDDVEPLGEVYVLGVTPDAQRLGLGSALTLAGLRHLRGIGLSQVFLYVDEDNPQAVRMYERLGFVQWTTDVSFARVSPPHQS